MKRILAFVLLAAMVFATSCSSVEPELMDFLGPQGSSDFGGVTITFNSGSNSEAEDDDGNKKGILGSVFSYQIDTLLGDAVMQRTEEVEKELNVVIEYEYELDRDVARTKLMTGTWNADIVNYTGMGYMQNFASAGLLLPITDFSDIIDLNQKEKYGGANILEGGMINSVPYAVQPVSWPGWEPNECYALVYNRDMLSANAITDPQEFYENETWYWDTFENEYLAKVNIVSGSERIPCLATGVDPLYYCLSYSNDVQYVQMGADGEFKVTATPNELIEALEEGRSWVMNYPENLTLPEGYWSHDEYDEENGLMTLCDPNTLITGNLAYEVDFFSGIMPFPCGPSSEYGVWAQAVQRIEGFGIPTSSQEPEIAAHVISLMFEPLDDYIGTLEEYYNSMVFDSDLDTEIYLALSENARYDYTFDGGSDLMRGVNNNLAGVLRSSKTVSEAIQSYAGQIEAIATKHILPNYDYMYNNYYAERDAE